ncbi:MAG: DUF1893 domain-containing protein [Firmicutes bacterium]|nr:DUF1893 domain-containing protein [Bacillota bacterium]
MNETERAIALLRQGDYSCVFCDRDRVLTDRRRGIAPILERIEAGESLHGMAVADKIIGKAAAMLLLCGGARSVYGEVMSEPAKALLEGADVEVAYGTLVKAIRNRTDTDICPMEKAVAALKTPAEAPAALRAALNRLK